MIWIDENSDLAALENYLLQKQWIGTTEKVKTIEKAGEGNMNVVLRVSTTKDSFILKQSRPFVQKYQEIPAPLNRIAVEYIFYSTTASILANHVPKIIGYGADAFILCMEDLGQCRDMGFIYEKQAISEKVLKELVAVLSSLHSVAPPKDFPENLEMRQLNHQHIFELPFMTDNGFSLDTIQPGLQKLSEPYKNDPDLKKVVSQLGERYLSQGDTLLHGDYYPGSWMTAKDQLYIIDAEFGFVGFAEFDIGVMAGHCILAAHNTIVLDKILEHYTKPVDAKLTAQIAGVEIMRRLLGLAQLPLVRSLVEKKELLQLAHRLIMGPTKS